MNKITFVDYRNAISICDSDGSNSRHLTDTYVKCVWPTWSRRGNNVAVSRFGAGENGHGSLRLLTSTDEGLNWTETYANDSGTDAIAKQTPHYILWAPDGKTLAFIAQTKEKGLTLYVTSLEDEIEVSPLLSGGPIFISWSYDSKYLAVHSGPMHYLIEMSSMNISQVPVVSAKYMAPSWNPVKNEVALCAEISDSQQGLLVSEIDGSKTRIVAELNGSATFLWNPKGGELALARNLDDATGYYQQLSLVDVVNTTEKVIYQGPILAAYWSPAGTKIACVTPSSVGNGSLRWTVIDRGGPEILHTDDFRPSQEQMIAYMFFDQYGQSHSPWSPDSTMLVFGGVTGLITRRTTLPDKDVSQIYTAHASGLKSVAQIAQGTFGVWSQD